MQITSRGKLLAVLLLLCVALLWLNRGPLKQLLQPTKKVAVAPVLTATQLAERGSIPPPMVLPFEARPLPVRLFQRMQTGQFDETELLLTGFEASAADPTELAELLRDLCEHKQAYLVARAWVAQRPESRWAKPCYAISLVQKGIAKRGSQLRASTTGQQFDDMATAFDEALPLLQIFYNELSTRHWVALPLMNLLNFFQKEVDGLDADAVFVDMVARFPKYEALYYSRTHYLGRHWGGSLTAQKRVVARAIKNELPQRTIQGLQAWIAHIELTDKWYGQDVPISELQTLMPLPLSTDGSETVALGFDKALQPKLAQEMRNLNVSRGDPYGKALMYRAAAYKRLGGSSNIDLSIKDYVAAAQSFNQHAIDMLVYALTYGSDLSSKDLASAVPWIQLGAENACVESEALMAWLYFGGRHGVENNLSKAQKMVERSAWHGHSQAQHDWGNLVLHFAKPDAESQAKAKAEANFWYRLAAEGGNADAQARLKATEKNNSHHKVLKSDHAPQLLSLHPPHWRPNPR
jgi:hypothetical protein